MHYPTLSSQIIDLDFQSYHQWRETCLQWVERGPLFSMLPRDVAICSTSQLCTEHNLLEVSLSMKNREAKASVVSMAVTENVFTQ